jgi:hypothetical protein
MNPFQRGGLGNVEHADKSKEDEKKSGEEGLAEKLKHKFLGKK